MTLAEALTRASVFLKAQQFTYDALVDAWRWVFHLSYTDVILALHNPITAQQASTFNEVILRLAQHEPIQYIVSQAEFAGEIFTVTPDTLIPREDSYGLVEYGCHYLQSHPTATRMLDIGTGTGVLAISIKKRVPTVEVIGSDISSKALTVAKENAKRHDVSIEWIESDLLTEFSKQKPFDLIVCNPPYIADYEQDVMDESVKRYEPEIALYAAHNGYEIYERLAQTVSDYITETACILLEVGYQQADNVMTLFREVFSNATIESLLDLNGHKRYIRIQLSKEESK